MYPRTVHAGTYVCTVRTQLGAENTAVARRRCHMFRDAAKHLLRAMWSALTRAYRWQAVVGGVDGYMAS